MVGGAVGGSMDELLSISAAGEIGCPGAGACVAAGGLTLLERLRRVLLRLRGCRYWYMENGKDSSTLIAYTMRKILSGRSQVPSPDTATATTLVAI